MHPRRMKFLGVAGAVSLALTLAVTGASASSGVSPKFDGTYTGTMAPADGVASPACGTAAVSEMVVRGGIIRQSTKIANTDAATFDGFVTEEGFVKGHVRYGGTIRTFEGRMTNEGHGTMLSGGVTDDQTGCAWLVELRQR